MEINPLNLKHFARASVGQPPGQDTELGMVVLEKLSQEHIESAEKSAVELTVQSAFFSI